MEWQNKRKPTDRALEPKVFEKLSDAELFQRMQDVESNLDALVQRKRLDLQDMIGRSMRKNETLRIFVSSSVFNQEWQKGTPLYFEGGKPHWALRVEGRLVNDDPEKGRAFSSMITSVIVELKRLPKSASDDRMEGVETESEVKREPLQPTSNAASGDAASGEAAGVPAAGGGANGSDANGSDANGGDASTPRAPAHDGSVGANPPATEQQKESNNDSGEEIVEWHESCVPPEQRVDFDGLDVKRTGSEPVQARIQIQLKEYPDKFKLSPQLANILGVTEESKPGAVVSLWQYIRYHKLQDVDEKRMIKCNGPLFNLFKREKIPFPQLVQLLSPHLSPRQPITIDYTINPGEDVGNRDVAFDVPIQVDHPLRSELLVMLNSWQHDTGSINKLEDLLMQDVQALNLLAHQHDFYEELSKDPITFLDKWVASQARDLKIIYCDRRFNEEAARHSSFYTDDLLNQSLHLFLSKHS